MFALCTSGSPTSMAFSKSSVSAMEGSYPSLSASPFSLLSPFPSNRSDSFCVASTFTIPAGISSFSSISSAVSSSSSSFNRNQLSPSHSFPMFFDAVPRLVQRLSSSACSPFSLNTIFVNLPGRMEWSETGSSFILLGEKSWNLGVL